MTFIIEGHIAAQPPDFFGIVSYQSTDAAVTTPLDLSVFNVAFPAWGTVDSDSTNYSATSILVLVQPSSNVVLENTIAMEVYDVTADVLIGVFTMYKGGADFLPGVACYLERYVANSALSAKPWPEYPLDDSPPGVSPFVASNGNLIRYTFGPTVPPSPPFPPYLPPTPSWPTITPAPTPPTASFPPGQPANQVLGIGANYTVFSNFGYKG